MATGDRVLLVQGPEEEGQGELRWIQSAHGDHVENGFRRSQLNAAASVSTTHGSSIGYRTVRRKAAVVCSLNWQMYT